MAGLAVGEGPSKVVGGRELVVQLTTGEAQALSTLRLVHMAGSAISGGRRREVREEEEVRKGAAISGSRAPVAAPRVTLREGQPL